MIPPAAFRTSASLKLALSYRGLWRRGLRPACIPRRSFHWL